MKNSASAGLDKVGPVLKSRVCSDLLLPSSLTYVKDHQMPELLHWGSISTLFYLSPMVWALVWLTPILSCHSGDRWRFLLEMNLWHWCFFSAVCLPTFSAKEDLISFKFRAPCTTVLWQAFKADVKSTQGQTWLLPADVSFSTVNAETITCPHCGVLHVRARVLDSLRYYCLHGSGVSVFKELKLYKQSNVTLCHSASELKIKSIVEQGRPCPKCPPLSLITVLKYAKRQKKC